MSDDEMTIDDSKLLLDGIGTVVIRFMFFQWLRVVPLEGEVEVSKALASGWDTLLRVFY